MDEDFEDVNLDALAAVIGLQREELEDAEANGRGADAQALRTQLATLEREIQLERDIRLTQSIALANMADAGAIEYIRQENEEEFDVDEDDEEDQEIMNTQKRPATNDLNVLSKLAGRYVSREAGQILLAQAETGEETWRYADQVVETPIPTDECLICSDEREFCDTMQMPCEHVYCHDCIHELFNKSFLDEGLFPARCCRNQLMHQPGIEIFLTKEIRDTFAEKAVEFATTDRTYCFSKTCSAFIAPVNHNAIRGYARCAKCPRLTCLKCKKKHHGKNDCPPDPAARALLALAHEEGWQRCGRCDFLVELNTGCYHITCRCKSLPLFLLTVCSHANRVQVVTNSATSAQHRGRLADVYNGMRNDLFRGLKWSLGENNAMQEKFEKYSEKDTIVNMRHGRTVEVADVMSVATFFPFSYTDVNSVEFRSVEPVDTIACDKRSCAWDRSSARKE